MRKYDLPVDMIFSITPTDPLAFMAARMGFLIGTNSGQKCLVERPEHYTWAFPISFIDNEFKKYDHDAHMAAIKQHRPKYATVRDAMTSVQCCRAGIEHFDLDIILAWAEEVEQYAENVIVIPKWDCLAEIPERFILGYSIPSRYAGTPLPFEMFRGRKIHLLGGSWKKQLKYLQFAKDDIVSLDNNNLWKCSVYGGFDWPDGKKGSLHDLGITELTSPMYASVAMSLGHIATKLHQLYNEPQKSIEFAVQLPGMEKVT